MSGYDPFALDPNAQSQSLFSGAPWAYGAASAPTAPQPTTYQDWLGGQQLELQRSYNDQMISAYQNANAPPSKFSQGVGTFGTVVQGLSDLASIYMGWQNMKQQKKQFAFNKGVINTNLNNSIMDYNRRLGDTLANRALNNGKGDGWVSEQLAKYSARRH